MFQDHWLTGLGIGNFPKFYLYYQANYFQSGTYSNKELLLADNTYFAFNDYWQWVIETGILGILILLLYLKVLVKFISQALNKGPILRIASSTVIILSVAAIFTHVFNILLFQIAYIISAITILFVSQSKKSIYIRISAVIILIFNAYYKQIIFFESFERLSNARELLLYGFNDVAYKELKALELDLSDEPSYLAALGKASELTGVYELALTAYMQLNKLKPSNITTLRIAECYRKLGNPKALQNFKTAINMVPNRFVMRSALFYYYKDIQNFDAAALTGNQILKLPIKVKSKLIIDIKSNIKKELQTIK